MPPSGCVRDLCARGKGFWNTRSSSRSSSSCCDAANFLEGMMARCGGPAGPFGDCCMHILNVTCSHAASAEYYTLMPDWNSRPKQARRDRACILLLYETVVLNKHRMNLRTKCSNSIDFRDWTNPPQPSQRQCATQAKKTHLQQRPAGRTTNRLAYRLLAVETWHGQPLSATCVWPGLAVPSAGGVCCSPPPLPQGLEGAVNSTVLLLGHRPALA
jgi:hypothetical protein